MSFAKNVFGGICINLFDVNILQFIKEMRGEEVVFFGISVHFDH